MECGEKITVIKLNWWTQLLFFWLKFDNYFALFVHVLSEV